MKRKNEFSDQDKINLLWFTMLLIILITLSYTL